MITPIEDIEYINFFQYLTERLRVTYGEENFNTLIKNPHFVAGMDVITAMSKTEGLNDKVVLNVINSVSLEILKDCVIFGNGLEGNLRNVFEPSKVFEYFLQFKRDSNVASSPEEMKIVAERLVAGFYSDVFSEN